MSVLEKAPAAEMGEGQIDEHDIPSYEVSLEGCDVELLHAVFVERRTEEVTSGQVPVDGNGSVTLLTALGVSLAGKVIQHSAGRELLGQFEAIASHASVRGTDEEALSDRRLTVAVNKGFFKIGDAVAAAVDGRMMSSISS